MYKERVAEWLQIMLDLIIHLSMVEVANFTQGWIKPYNGTHKSLPLIKNKSRVIAFNLVIKYINIVKISIFKCFKVIEFIRNPWTHFMLDIKINNSVDTSRTYLSVERPINEHEQYWDIQEHIKSSYFPIDNLSFKNVHGILAFKVPTKNTYQKK